ncbi:MAG: hypothetical protein LR015_02420 [Verrucomicrobia bacterium]|nr:hypothetical protein [Verrucomicrobiota bacterium]
MKTTTLTALVLSVFCSALSAGYWVHDRAVGCPHQHSWLGGAILGGTAGGIIGHQFGNRDAGILLGAGLGGWSSYHRHRHYTIPHYRPARQQVVVVRQGPPVLSREEARTQQIERERSAIEQRNARDLALYQWMPAPAAKDASTD